MRRTLILLLSAAIYSTQALKLAVQSDVLDACATVDCASGLVCGLAIPQTCNVSPCPKMPTCLPKNQTCDAKSCKSDETCVLRSVTCIMAPCYPVRECAKFPKCGANEEYNECSLSGPCEPTCNDSFPICSNVTCGSGACECKPGYYRHNGKCVSKSQCPTPTCEKPNEVWNTCPSACTQTCRIFRGKDEQMPCPAVCDIPQCTCAVGYVRDDDWNCVKQNDCPKEFKCSSPQEEYKECSSHCEPTCDNQWPSCIESCGPAKCQCKPNYVRHDGSCLFALQCPLEGNSTMRAIPAEHDVSGSEEVSEENSGEQVSGPSCATIRCGGNTSCIMKGGKPICAKCGKNEKMDSCPNPCSEKTCEDGDIMRKCVAIKMCYPPKCVCDEGFLRNTKSGQCVKQNQCPKADNSTVHILPWTKPLVRPAHPEVDPAVHIMPVFENGSMLVDPIPANFNRPQVRPFYPDNGTMHIMPHHGNATIQISPPYVGPHVRPAFPPRSNESILADPRPLVRPFFPDNNITDDGGKMHILPFIPRDDAAVHIMPHFGNDSMLVDPIPSNRTRPQVRPFYPDNGTMHIMPHFGNATIQISPPYVGPLVRPAFPPRNGSNETILTDPIPQILPFPPRDDGAVHIMPVNENGTMHILPANWTRPLIKPFFPPHNDNGTMISLPYVPNFNGFANGTASILPFFPGNGSVHATAVNENGTMHVRPIFSNATRPQVMPLFPGKDNGTMHIMPFPNEGAVHIMPVVGNGTMHILPFNWTRPAIKPFKPDNGTMHILPHLENETMHILPVVDPNPGAIHVMPVPANASSSVCANHTCPAGSWCEETPVMCLVAPCPPIPTCVSTSAGGGGRDQLINCGKNEEYSECAPRCEETCRGVSDCGADMIMAAVCTPGCVCRDKFKRDGNGVCVPNHKCWKTAQCQDNEIWHKCRSCEATCTDTKEMCTAECVSGCACDDGFVRGPKGDCIVQSRCPK